MCLISSSLYSQAHTQETTSSYPKKIALLLPLSGPFEWAGYAVMRGFLASYYSDPSEVAIQIFDSHAMGVKSAVQQALNSGAECLIGPLTQEEVRQAQFCYHRQVPWLVLNKVSLNHKTSLLFQFGLPVEDEVLALVNQLDLLGYQSPLLIGAQNTLGERIQKKWVSSWGQLNHNEVILKLFNPNDRLNELIMSALLIQESKTRFLALKRYLGHVVQHTLRHRQDVDAIFIQANRQQLSQIIPMLHYCFVSDLPLLSLSSAHCNLFEKQNDLNGLCFLASPWQINISKPMLALKNAILSFKTHTFDRLNLYAFGMDAALIYKHLPCFHKTDEVTLSGETGRLTIRNTGVISSERRWATIKQGRVIWKSLPKNHSNPIDY